MRRLTTLFTTTLVLTTTPATGQVILSPTHIKPAAFERISARVVNQIADPIVEVYLTVPEVIDVVGVDAPDNWTFWIERASDSTPQTVGFTGGGITEWEMEEFALMGRLQGDSKQESLFFPARVVRASGEETRWQRGASGDGDPPVILVQGTTEITPWGTLAAAAGAFGMAALALAFSVMRSRPQETA